MNPKSPKHHTSTTKHGHKNANTTTALTYGNIEGAKSIHKTTANTA